MKKFSRFGITVLAVFSLGIAASLAETAKIESFTNRPSMRLKIKLFTGWTQDKSTNSPATFYRRQSQNPLQVSWAEYRGKKPLEKISTDKLKETATTFGQKQGFGNVVESSGGACTFGSFGTAVFRSKTHPRIQVWFITDGTDYILATHICASEPDAAEVRETQEIVRMLRLGPEEPNTSKN